jgi:microcin C transport system substrate-binding protein
MKIKFMDGTTNWKNLMERNFTVYMQSWGGLVFPNPETSLHSSLADQSNNNNISGFKNARVDTLLELYDVEFDQQKRVEIIREIDGIYSNIHPAAWGIARNYQRLLWWDKFGHPEYVVSRYTGDYRSIFSYWWVDPEKEARLNKAIEIGEALPVTDIDITFWPEYLKSNQ